MGESVLDAPKVENKMGDSVVSESVLEVSVSFGRFDNDSLSWDKWSAFSQNKYLEEVGKCSTPGSVAKKKAYFEAHYKKIAARKAELIEEEKQMEVSNSGSDESNGGKFDENKQMGIDNFKLKESNGGEFDEIKHMGIDNFKSNDSNESNGVIFDEIKQMGIDNFKSNESNVSNRVIFNESKQMGIDNFKSNVSNGVIFYESKQIGINNFKSNESNGGEFDEIKHMGIDNLKSEESNCGDLSRKNGGVDEKFDVFEEVECDTEVCESLAKDGGDDKLDSNMEDRENGVLVKEESICMGSKDTEEERAVKLEDEIGNSRQDLVENLKLDQQNESQKIAPANKARDLTKTKKKLISSTSKSQQISSAKVSKQASNSTTTSSARSSVKKGNGLVSSKTKNSPVVESKSRVPTSLHMSLSLGPTNSDQTPLTTIRRSLIMESMGDKDIVKRAFKSFQNNVNQLKSPADGRSASKQVLTKGVEQKVSTSVTPRKENEGRKASEKMIAQRGQTKPRGSSMPSRSLRTGGLDQRSAKPAPSSLNLRRDEKTEKRREFMKKLEEKSNAREAAERTQVQSQPKEEKDVELKKLRQSLNFKATPMPSFYRVQGPSKGRLDKGGVKSENN